MKNTINLFLVAAIFILVDIKGNGSSPTKEDPAKAIERANADFGRSFSKGDANAVAEMYTEKARLLPPNANIIEGRMAIENFWKGVMDAGVKEVELKTVEIESFGDSLVEQGIATLYRRDRSVVDRGKYFVLWKKVDGKWKLHRDCWNSNLPTP